VAARSRAAVMEGGFEPKSGCRTGDERWEHAVAVSRQTVVDQRRPVAADMRQGENSGADLTGWAALHASSRSIDKKYS
jgi:hypothetical protein